MRLLACMMIVCATASAQPVPPPPGRPAIPGAPTAAPGSVVPQPAPSIRIHKGVSAEDEAAYRKARASYDECSRRNANAMQLTESADGVIHLRDRRPFWESEFKRNATLRLRYPGGYDQMLADSFKEYRTLGGTATTVNAVQAVPPPCTRPVEPAAPPSASPDTESKSKRPD